MDASSALIKSLWRPVLVCRDLTPIGNCWGTGDITTGHVSQIPQQSALNALKAGLSFGGYLTLVIMVF